MENNLKNDLRGIFSLVLLTILFASIGIFSRIMQQSFALFQQTYLRMFVALILGFIFFKNDLRWNRFFNITKKDLFLMIIRAFSYYVGGVILFTLAIFNTTLGNVSLIQALPFIALFGILFFKEKLTKGKLFFLILSFIGVMFISINNLSSLLAWGKGQTLSLISSILFSFSYISRKWQSDYLNNKEITQIVLFFAIIFLIIGSFLSKEGLPNHGWNLLVLGALLISGLYNVIMLFLVNYGFKNVKPLLASNLLTLEGFFAIIFGFVFYKEIPMIKDIFGGVLIIIAVIGMNYLESKL